MPTPFTHLEAAQHLLTDEKIPQPVLDALNGEKPAFLLGNIAADARTEAALSREHTHFYDYTAGITEHPWRVMMRQYPELDPPRTPARRAFLAGYVAHLAMDEIWTLDMLGPHFIQREWASRSVRFFMLHILLSYMDERDYQELLPWQQPTLIQAQPADWLPFMSDAILRDWRDFIGGQIPPAGISRTLEVMGGRINRPPDELRAVLDSPDTMARDLWAHITPPTLQAIESTMYSHARDQLCLYWAESE